MGNTVETLRLGKYTILRKMAENYLCNKTETKIAQIFDKKVNKTLRCSGKIYSIPLEQKRLDKYDYGQFTGEH